METDTDLSPFSLNNRSVKLVPEKNSTISEAQTGGPQDDPEGKGQPTGEDSVQYGRVTSSFSLPSTPTATAAPRELITSQIWHWAWGSSLLRTYHVPSQILNTVFLNAHSHPKLDGDHSTLEMKKLVLKS